jgi:hypothetical protein
VNDELFCLLTMFVSEMVAASLILLSKIAFGSTPSSEHVCTTRSNTNTFVRGKCASIDYVM